MSLKTLSVGSEAVFLISRAVLFGSGSVLFGSGAVAVGTQSVIVSLSLSREWQSGKRLKNREVRRLWRPPPLDEGGTSGSGVAGVKRAGIQYLLICDIFVE